MPALKSGQTLASRFTLIRHLGRGGMGDVWLAGDENLGSEVAIKVVAAATTPETVSLLRQECRSARRLSHPNILRVFDFHQEPEASFISMEFVDGKDICQLRESPPRQIVATLLPLIDALAYAHRLGVVHRDLKCGNILLDGSGQPRLTDFGIAGVLEPERHELRLRGGGSRSHASPQQLAGESPSPADDVFGLGALLFELLTGTLPQGVDHVHRSLRSNPSFPDQLEALILGMLAPNPEDRPADMDLVRQALQEIDTQLSDEETMAPRVGKHEVRLSPPPKIPPVRETEPFRLAPSPGERQQPSSRHAHRWLTVTVFMALALGVFAVFVLLPRWVEEREANEIAAPASKRSEIATGQEVAEETPPVEAVTPAEVAGEPVVEPPAAEKSSRSSPPPTPQEPPAPPRPPARKVDPKVERFAQVMSAGLSALENGDYESAKRAFEEALVLVPGSAEAADGLASSQQELRLVAIADHRERGQAFEKEEHWQQAVDEYEAALALDPTLRFASVGRARAGSRARLNSMLTYHLENPERLADDRVLTEARDALVEGLGIDPVTPRLREQLRQLEQTIEVATSPVQVVLVSDNLTEVVVYRVGRLGRFDRKPLELRPGTYTVVGSREGYRDVRHKLEVVAGVREATLTVRCQEEI